MRLVVTICGIALLVVAAARAAGPAKAAEDAAWAAYFATAAAPATAPAADPAERRVFPNAIAFTDPQTYVIYRQPDVTYHLAASAPDPGNGKAQSRLTFTPDGRYRRTDVAYAGGEVLPKGDHVRDATVTVTHAAGRYTVAPDDTLRLDPDPGGPESTARLTDGRRHLNWGDDTYANTTWDRRVLENYQRRLEGQPEDNAPPKREGGVAPAR